jgi:hypothetical protein
LALVHHFYFYIQTILANWTVPAVQCLVFGVEGPLTQLPQLTNLRLMCEHVGRDWEPELRKVLAKVRADVVCDRHSGAVSPPGLVRF